MVTGLGRGVGQCWRRLTCDLVCMAIQNVGQNLIHEILNLHNSSISCIVTKTIVDVGRIWVIEGPHIDIWLSSPMFLYQWWPDGRAGVGQYYQNIPTIGTQSDGHSHSDWYRGHDPVNCYPVQFHNCSVSLGRIFFRQLTNLIHSYKRWPDLIQYVQTSSDSVTSDYLLCILYWRCIRGFICRSKTVLWKCHSKYVICI